MIRSFALAAAALLLSAQAPAPPTVTVTLNSYSIAPNPLRLPAGKPVRLHFVNASGKGHDFTAREFFSASRLLAGAAPDGQVELKGHRSATLDLIPAAGRYRAYCGHFMHKPMGMTATVLVE